MCCWLGMGHIWRIGKGSHFSIDTHFSCTVRRLPAPGPAIERNDYPRRHEAEKQRWSRLGALIYMVGCIQGGARSSPSWCIHTPLLIWSPASYPCLHVLCDQPSASLASRKSMMSRKQSSCAACTLYRIPELNAERPRDRHAALPLNRCYEGSQPIGKKVDQRYLHPCQAREARAQDGPPHAPCLATCGRRSSESDLATSLRPGEILET